MSLRTDAMRQFNPRSRRASGFTLIEVLVAVIVLCIGLLGIAKMSLLSVQSNNSAYMRSQAAILIEEIIDDMHANLAAAVAGSYDVGFGPPGAAPITCGAASCALGTSAAAYDIWVWKSRLAAGASGGTLPAGDGKIAVTISTVNGQTEASAVVTVQWNDNVAQAALGTPLANQQLVVETLL
jgi:type IV pilus assembly protein PilV